MSTTTEDLAAALAFVAAVADRRAGVVSALAELQELLRDVPRLAALAERGLLDQALIRQHAGLQERAASVRELHDLTELPGTGPICTHCSELARRPIAWPCPTTDRNDG